MDHIGISKLKRGELVEFRKLGNTQWAVYVGNGEIVAGGDKDSRITRSSLQVSPVSGVHTRINNDLDEHYTPLAGDAIVARAMSKIGTVIGAFTDGVRLRSGEHFAKWCRYGEQAHQLSPYVGLDGKRGEATDTNFDLGSVGFLGAAVVLPSGKQQNLESDTRSGGAYELQLAGVDVLGAKASVGAGMDASVNYGSGKYGADLGLDVAKAQVGPVGAKLGVRLDTGVTSTEDNIGFQVAGTGLQIGRETKISLLGSSVSFKWPW